MAFIHTSFGIWNAIKTCLAGLGKTSGGEAVRYRGGWKGEKGNSRYRDGEYPSSDHAP